LVRALSQLDTATALVLAALITIIGYGLQAYFTKKKELDVQMHEIKQRLFSAMVDEIPYVFIPQYRDKLPPDQKLEHAERFFGPYRKLWLFASDATIRKMNNVIDLFSPPSSHQDRPTATIAEFILSLRKELGIQTDLTITDVRFVTVK